MSISNLLEEELERKLRKIGLESKDVEAYETRDKQLLLYLKTGQKVKITDPYLVKLAKAKTNEEKIACYLSKDALLARLYTLESIFKGKIKLEDFINRYSSLDPPALLKRIKEIEEESRAHLSQLKEYLIIRIQSLLTRKGPYYLECIETSLYGKTTQELAEIYMKLSVAEKITPSVLETLLDVQ